MEQDELAMSLSTAKFKLLKNANLERVKAEDRLSESDEANHFRMTEKKKANDKGTNDSFRDMPEHVYDDLPSDTFKDIPEDVFEKIPRAVTARIQNRERKKQQPPKKRQEEALKETTMSGKNPEQFTASAPMLEENANREESISGSAKDPAAVGFIAMLFTGRRDGSTGFYGWGRKILLQFGFLGNDCLVR